MNISIIQSLAEINSDDWNALTVDLYPFSSFAYLYGLEQHQCLHPFGWNPFYFLIQQDNKLIAATVCYVKSNSYGELVFDHTWADAYQRSGLDYYPKLVTAIPYTPATGARFFIHPDINDKQFLEQALINHVIEFCQHNNLSSWHVLFCYEKTSTTLKTHSFSTRYDCQFHWNNNNYQTFDDFLSQLASRKRKNIKKERLCVNQNNLTIKQRLASELSAHELSQVHQLYASIFLRKYGEATLSKEFFISLGENLGEQTLLISAHDSTDKMIAVSMFFKSQHTLYGRVWGCNEDVDFLHFELCYYQGIEYCIQHQLKTFDPGAQGEHKISRGFLPTKTTSAHWIANKDFREVIERFTVHEKSLMDEHCDDLKQKSPYKSNFEL
ncbi:MAG: GNAT family N-acetyltransferase [Gammaproteobacteria bacterium]|nr:GNAT family N-acetyltransferase [Gammaproteobacteria bacterium]